MRINDNTTAKSLISKLLTLVKTVLNVFGLEKMIGLSRAYVCEIVSFEHIIALL
jgi:hypothetical protein